VTLVYLSYLEPLSGVYAGQVIDGCKYVEDAFRIPVQLIPVISWRDYRQQGAALLERAPQAKAICAPFGWRAWPLIRALVRRQIAASLPKNVTAILARGPLATAFARDLKNQERILATGYDGRGAISAEWSHNKEVEGKDPTPSSWIRL
jgi:hypothetical protein